MPEREPEPVLGHGITIGFKTSPSNVEWGTLDETWALAGELEVYSAGWVSDHLTDPAQPRGGASFEALTTVAALAHRVPGKWIGIGVLSNTFRHPAVLAKQATVLDHATGGRFILGIGAGWHEGEHEALGIPLPPMRERFDRLEGSLRVLRALFSDEARRPPGVTLDDVIAPLRDATNEPPPTRVGGPPLFHGGQKPRGLELAGRYGDGWVLPMSNAGDLGYWHERRDAIRRAMEAARRNPDAFVMTGQVACGTTATERATALQRAIALARNGAGHLVLGMPPSLGPQGLRVITTEVAEPLRAAL